MAMRLTHEFDAVSTSPDSIMKPQIIPCVECQRLAPKKSWFLTFCSLINCVLLSILGIAAVLVLLGRSAIITQGLSHVNSTQLNRRVDVVAVNCITGLSNDQVQAFIGPSSAKWFPGVTCVEAELPSSYVVTQYYEIAVNSEKKHRDDSPSDSSELSSRQIVPLNCLTGVSIDQVNAFIGSTSAKLWTGSTCDAVDLPSSYGLTQYYDIATDVGKKRRDDSLPGSEKANLNADNSTELGDKEIKGLSGKESYFHIAYSHSSHLHDPSTVNTLSKLLLLALACSSD